MAAAHRCADAHDIDHPEDGAAPKYVCNYVNTRPEKESP